MDYREAMGFDSEVASLRGALRDLAEAAGRAAEMPEGSMTRAASHLSREAREVADLAARVGVLREVLANLE